MVSDDFLGFNWNAIYIFLFYVCATFSLRKFAPIKIFRILFCALNLLSFLYFTDAFSFLYGKYSELTGFHYYLAFFIFQVYLCYLVLLYTERFRWNFYVPVLLPFILLFTIRGQSPVVFFGISFVVLRISYLSFEVGYRGVKIPSLYDYLSYLFYLPTLSLGPIERFSSFRTALDSKFEFDFRYSHLERLVLGLLKFVVFGSLAARLGFGFLGEVRRIDYGFWFLMVTGFFSYLTVYFQFSGFCDVMNSVSKLLGIPLIENFRNPLISRNPQDHWRRWHISLMEYFREVFYFPIAMKLQIFAIDRFRILISIVSIFFVFSLIGFWHGLGFQYMAFGWIHAAGVSWIVIFDHLVKRFLKNSIWDKFFLSRAWTIFSWSLTAIFLSFSYIVYFYGFSVFIY